MAVLTNTMMQGTAADTDDDAYQIEKSLRFNDPDSPSLTKTFSTGNTRTWTWAAWVKRSTTGVQHNLFSAYADGNNQGYLVLENDDMIAFDQRIGGTWSNSTKTDALFRDTSAWYHITFVFDSPNAVESERIRLFINGERYTGPWDDAPNCTQDLQGTYNSNVEHQIGRGQANSNYLDGYLADVHFIDGLALSPAAFGSFNSTGVFNPKTFALPTPNDSTTWSGSVTSSTGSYFAGGNYNPPKLFDGLLTTWVAADVAQSAITFSPSGGISYSQSVEVYQVDSGGTDSHKAVFTLTDTDGTIRTTSVEDSSGQWTTLHEGTGKFTELKAQANASANTFNYWAAIKVDGVILVDGQTDETYTEWAASTSDNVNSFHLKFNDTSTNGALGKTSINNGQLEGATGGLPIYNTSDDYGDVKGSGYRADSSAGTTDGTGLVLAVPGDSVASGTADVHQQINTGSSNKAVTVGNDAVVSTAESRLYGSSLYFDGTNDYLSFPNSSDFTFGSGNFTVECWVKPDGTPAANNGIMGQWDHSNDQRCWLIQTTTGNIFRGLVNINGTVGGNTIVTGTKIITPGQWHHLAFVRNSNTLYLYVNGFLDTSASFSGTVLTPSDPVLIGSTTVSDYSYKGWLNDARIYKGVAKYTANFKPPTRNDFTVNNLDAQVGITDTTTDTIKNWRCYKNYSGTSEYGVDYKIQWSNDNSTWTDAVSGNLTSGGAGCGWLEGDTAYAGSQTAKYWKLKLLGSTGVHAPRTTKIELKKADDSWVNVQSWSSGNESCNDSGEYTWDTIERTWTGSGTYYEATVADIDSLIDSPTNYGTDTGAGGEVRGNYCTWDPLSKGSDMTLSQGNLKIDTTSTAWTNANVVGTIGATTGKWYWEVNGTDAEAQFGIHKGSAPPITSSNFVHAGGTGYALYNLVARAYHDSSYKSWGSTWGTGDVIGVALDLDTGALWFSKNGAWTDASGTSNSATVKSQLEAGTTTNATYTWTPSGEVFRPCVAFRLNPDSGASYANFGQRAYKYTAPSGFKSLCTQNLDDLFGEADKNNPSKYFDITTYTGDGNSTRTITGVFDFAADLVWSKNRSTTNNNQIYDRIRGDGNRLHPDSDIAENTNSGTYGFVEAGTAAGSIDIIDGSDGSYNMNESGNKFVVWAWDAGTAASGANNDGSLNIASGDQWTNQTAGFSITKYTGPGSGDFTFGHGLNAVPDFIIIKQIDATGNWIVQHKDITLGSGRLILNSNTSASTSHADIYWNSTAPTNTLISIGDNSNVYDNGGTFICYAWTPIPGYSAFGKYTGNDDTDGPFVYTGFKPRWFLMKETNDATNWLVYDSERDVANPTQFYLFPNDSAGGNTYDASSTNLPVDFLSNGFKIRNDNSGTNADTQTYIWTAFADHPFKIARAQ